MSKIKDADHVVGPGNPDGRYLGSSLPSNPGDADFRDLGLNLGGLLVDKGDGPLLPSPGAGRVVCRRETKQDANISKFIYSFFFFFFE